MRAVRVGIVDSGLPDAERERIAASRSFCGGARVSPAGCDRLEHGGALARMLLGACPAATLHVAQIFERDRVAAPGQLAAAIEWLADEGVHLIHMSVGLATPHAGLRLACRRAAAAGIVLVASSAARGSIAYPAAYAECIAVTGDARCGPDEVSWLGTDRAEFGAHPFAVAGGPGGGGGASFAAARVSGILLSLLADGVAAGRLRAELAARCALRGAERRSIAQPEMPRG